jgi:DNA-binding NtrC family response regulator
MGMAQNRRILIADDQQDVLEALRLLLKGEGFEVEAVTSPAGVLQAIEERDFHAVLMDLNYTRDTTSGREGLELLTQVKELDPTLPIIVMTAWGSVEGAVEACGGARVTTCRSRGTTSGSCATAAHAGRARPRSARERAAGG